MSHWKSYLEEHRETFLHDLVQFLSIPSVSTSPEHGEDVRRAAQWTADRIRRAGISDVRIMETKGHPVVYAERIESPDKPTVLIYGHFDVQPAEPLELWMHPPFHPHIEDGKIYARAASDMKGNVLLSIVACEALLQTRGMLPVNIKFLIEGEEEIGSPSLGGFIQQNRQLLACDLTISADGGIGTREQPQIGLSNRGLAGLQVRVKTADVDLHSGAGGYAPNALHGLISILESLRDEEGRIQVDGFYEDVKSISDAERDVIAKMTPAFDAVMRQAGVKTSFGEPEYTPVERSVARPTLEINGMWGGFQGQGVKTVIPHEAFAKITCRLAANQDPEKIRELVKAHIYRVAPDYVDVFVEDLPGSAYPYQLPAEHTSVVTLQRILEQTTGKHVKFERSGGTVPVMGMLRQTLGVETITVGASQKDERAHAPNEFLRLENFYWLQEVVCMYLEELPGVLRQ